MARMAAWPLGPLAVGTDRGGHPHRDCLLPLDWACSSMPAWSTACRALHGAGAPCRRPRRPLADLWTPRQLVIAGALLVGSLAVGARFVHLDAQTRSMQQVTDLGRWVAERTPVDRPPLTPHLGIAVEADAT